MKRGVLSLLWVALFAAALPAFADKKDDAPQVTPFITALFPAGGQRGQTVEVVMSGTNLVTGTGTEIAGTVQITGTGLAASILPAAESKPADAKNPKPIRLSISVAPGADLGPHDLRFVTPNGASNRARFFVGQLPEINEVEPNSDFAKAQRLPALPILVNGRIDQSDRDYFRFTAKAGQTLVCEVAARAIVPYIADAVPGWCDPILTLYDSGGKPLQTVDDFRSNPDPVLFFTVPKDGEYVLGIWDVLYRGRNDFVYRLSIGELPYLTHVFPLGGQRGSTVSLELHGVNLPEKTREYPFTSDPASRRSLGVSIPAGSSNLLPLAAGDLPETTEVEPNDTQAQAQRVTLPVTINGRIQKSGDVDWFVFAAKAGDKLTLEVLARRLGSPLDSVLTLYDAKGAELAENDDTPDPAEQLLTQHTDSYLAYTVPAAGDYFVRIRDAAQKGGDEYAYRLTLAPPQPNVTLRVTPDNPTAGRGDNALLTVEALRTGGFNGEIPLTVEGLPPGCVVSGAVIQANQTEVNFTVSIPPDAPLSVSSPVISGTTTLAGKQVVLQAAAAEAVMQAFASTHNVPTKELLLSVTEPPPITITTSVQPGEVLELKQGGELQIPIKAVRHNDVKGGISVTTQKPTDPKAKPIAPGVTARAPYVAADKDETVLTVTATKQAPVGIRNITVMGIIKVGKTSRISIAPAVSVKIVPGDK